MKIVSISALYVDAKGSYPQYVTDWWDVKRNAMLYAGPNAIVAHPPCQRWCRLAGLVEARWGHKRGDDGGTFAAALASLRTWGGVLEHPAFSDAWAAHGLPRPKSGAGWHPGARAGEWTCYVEQWRYGHKARKATWLYYVGARKPFELRWGLLDARDARDAGCKPWRESTKARRLAWVSQCGNHGSNPQRLSKSEAIRTPRDFLWTLLILAAWSRCDTF